MEYTKRELIKNRIEHVDMIFALRHHYCDPKLIKNVGENGWSHPWEYFDALMNYLLLTCFDLLGQPTDWVSFTEWLTSRKKETERNICASQIPPESNQTEVVVHFNTAYQRIYGVKNSFNNFVLNMLTNEEREDLYFNIKITRGVKGGDPNTSYPALGDIEDEKKKLAFLFTLRNKFTHGAVTMGSGVAGVFPNVYDHMTIEGKQMKGYIEIHREANGKEWLIYAVRDWPFALKRILNSALDRHCQNG